jgi:predicted nucleotidyltransferase
MKETEQMNPAIAISNEQGRLLRDLVRQYLPDATVWAYGSRVKGTARNNSDLDLVVFTTPDKQRLVSEFKDALGESNLPFIVDLHVWDDLPESFHQRIREHYAVLQEAVPSDDRLKAAGYGV